MAKEKLDQDLGLEEAMEAPEQKPTKKEKVQTPEELEIVNAGVELVKKFGVSDEFSQVMELVPFWNGEKDVLSTKKEEVITKFGGSDKLKDYVDGPFQEELKGILGTAKVGSILNNIKSFYARRASSTKTKFTQVNIGGTLYNVDAEYYNSITALPREEKRELLLAHSATKQMENIPEIL